VISLPVVLAVAAVMFGIGLYGVLGPAMLNVVGFLRYSQPDATSGAFFVLIVMTLMAVEAAVGFALVVSAWRHRRTAELDDLTELKG
jgi:NAD(P)H-quinone oxidoreductase subunit 4L